LGVFALDAPSRIYAPTAKIKNFDPGDGRCRWLGIPVQKPGAKAGRPPGGWIPPRIRYRMGNSVSDSGRKLAPVARRPSRQTFYQKSGPWALALSWTRNLDIWTKAELFRFTTKYATVRNGRLFEAIQIAAN